MWAVAFDCLPPRARGRSLTIPVSRDVAGSEAEAKAWARGYVSGRDMHITEGVDLRSARVEQEPTR